VGPVRLSAPALPPLRFKKQTVSLASAGGAVDPPADEQKEEEEANGAAAACPAFSLLAPSQQAAGVPHASVCMQDASLPW